mgnify:CR=1 FL=1
MEISVKGVKNKEIEFQKKKKRRALIKKILFIFAVLEIVSLTLVTYYWCRNFFFGKAMVALFAVINVSMIMVRVFIIDSTTIPKNDPGIVIYWLCCLRFGQRGKYSEEYKMKQVKKNL